MEAGVERVKEVGAVRKKRKFKNKKKQNTSESEIGKVKNTLHNPNNASPEVKDTTTTDQVTTTVSSKNKQQEDQKENMLEQGQKKKRRRRRGKGKNSSSSPKEGESSLPSVAQCNSDYNNCNRQRVNGSHGVTLLSESNNKSRNRKRRCRGKRGNKDNSAVPNSNPSLLEDSKMEGVSTSLNLPNPNPDPDPKTSEFDTEVENENTVSKENNLNNASLPPSPIRGVIEAGIPLSGLVLEELNKKSNSHNDEEGSSNNFVFPVEGSRKEEQIEGISVVGSVPRPRVSRRRKLLVLDINGLLADINMDYRYADRAHTKISGKLVFRRPYCDDFLRFCFRDFDVGIWSSRNKYNVDRAVDFLLRDLKYDLLFCWDQSKCTVTGFQTIENTHKPLVLKELKKLWDKEEPDLPWGKGEYNPSNTLLVDDSPYKAVCNPPYTAIFPHPYSFYDRRDYSLGRGGDLRVYLENVARAEDVQCFVRENPFGQPPITDSDPSWHFYLQIINQTEKPPLLSTSS